MPIIFLITFLMVVLLTYALLSLRLMRKVHSSHKIAHIYKYVNNGKFNEAFNISRSSEDEVRKHYLRPVVDIDNKNLRRIIFVNNVNSVMLGQDNNLLFELNLKSQTETYYYFITDNYKIDENQTIAENLVSNNFPKSFNNNIDYYDFINLKDLGSDIDVKIKNDDIGAIVFNGKDREMIMALNDHNRSIFSLKYKSKKAMIEMIKETSLYNTIMQWGIAGYENSKLTYVEEEGGSYDDDN